MKIPRKIKVGANQINIRRVELAITDADQSGGWFEWETNTLCLAMGMPEDREATCFLHEVIHAINIYLSEKLVTAISELLIQAIRANDLDFRETGKHEGSRG